MRKRLFASLVFASAMTLASAANSYGIPDNIQDGNILHLFCWNANDARAALPEIAEAGFGAIQLSPMQGNAAANAEWFYAYMPYDMAFVSTGVGTQTSVKRLCQEAEKYGIKVIVDVVANHINGAKANRADKWNNTSYWHSASFRDINYNDRRSITHDNLGDYPDLNSENAEVQKAVAEYVATLKACGVKGIRWDAAKHIALPSEGCGFWATVTAADGMWHYGELLDSPGGDENKLAAEYTKYMSITDNRYSTTILNSIRNNQAATAIGLWSQRGIAPTKLVYWAESHDTYANDGGATKYVSQAVIDRAWALGACRQGATALYLSRPFENQRTKIKMGVKGSTGFTAAHIAAVNHLRNAMGDTPEYVSAADGVTVVTRAGGGACIVVANGKSRAVSVPNGGGYVPAGTYKDEVSGSSFTVTPQTISGTVGASGIAVIYDASALTAPRMDFTPGAGTSFRSETLDVTVVPVNASEGSITIDGRTIAVGKEGKTVTIGKDIDKGQIKIDWTAKEGSATRSGMVTYTKIDPNERPADMPDKFYIIGEVNGQTWDPSKGVEMKASGSTFTADVKLKAAGYFSFASQLGTAGNWAAFNAAHVRYGFATDTSVSLGQSATFEKNDDPKAMTVTGITATKTYTVTVDWVDHTVTVSETAGIDAPMVDADSEAPVTYYTLDGRAVSEPLAPGLYIRRQGSKATKVLVR